MNIIKLVIIVLGCLFTLHFLKQDFKKGLSIAIFLLILIPRELFVEIGEDFPTLTGFRAIVLLLFFYAIYSGRMKMRWQKIPISKLLIMVFIAKVISLLFAYNFSESLNGVLVFAIESLLFFMILFETMDNEETVDMIIKSVTFAVVIIAILGIFEKYTHFNPVDYISLPDHPRFSPRMGNVIYSTLPHSIHFGIVLAMGWPICLYQMERQASTFNRYIYGVFLIFIIAGLYFSQSRGAWLGFSLMILILLVLKYPRIKVRTICIAYFAILVLMLRPGIFDTIYGLGAATFDENRIEGTSFFYRFELFRIAFGEIVKFPERFFFGYGDGSAQLLNIQSAVHYGSGREVLFWSWDSEYAVTILHGGIIGITFKILLNTSILVYLIKGIKSVDEKNKSLLKALLASNIVLFFMMTNVAIFAPQLRFLLWTNTAIGLFFAYKPYYSSKTILNNY